MIILHHYPTSPFAEKVRIALGIKQLAWRSVFIPVVMPKPDLTPLTGGYRKTPVMQIGADIYCDTQCILRELERRFPERSLYKGTDAGTANTLAFSIDRNLFSPAVGIVFGARDFSKLVPGFLEDRAKMTGREMNPERVRAARPMLEDQMRTQLVWFEQMLADGRPFLIGSDPTLVDCSLYCPTWFIHSNLGAVTPLTEFPRLLEWMGRMQQLGHGRPSKMDSKEALAIARDAIPTTSASTDASDPFGRTPGMKITVTPDDAGKDPVEGELVSLSADKVVLKRVDPQVGEVAVHFPRTGYVIKAVG